MKKLLAQGAILAFLLLCCAPINAQQYDETFDKHSIALSNQSAALAGSFCPIGNPALLPANKKITIGLSVTNKFLLTNLKQGGVGFCFKFSKTDALGIAIQFDGTVNFKQNTVALAYAKKINEKFAAGISFLYLNTFEQTIGSRNNYLVKAGISYQPTKNISIGVTVYNPFLQKLTTRTKERIPTYFQAGICYSVSTQVKIYGEFKLGLNEVRNFKLGLSYALKPGIILYAGFQNSNSPMSFGATIQTKLFSFHFAMQYHQVLGFSPAVGGEWGKE